MIKIENLGKQFPARTKGAQPVDALVDVDLTIRDHEFVTLLGPSGCGKTTLLRMVAGLETLDSGGTWTPCPATLRPPISTVPSSGDSKPAMMRRAVVLPQPLGPSSARIWPRGRSRSKPSSARVRP